MDHNREREIIEAVLAGDREAYASLVDAHKGAVYNLAYRMTGNSHDAEDLAQEAFLRAYSKLWRYDPSRPFFTWLYTIVLNLTRNHLKKSNRTEVAFDEWSHAGEGEGEEGNPGGPEDQVIDNEQHRHLQKSLMALPEDMREAVILRFIQDHSFEEVALIMGVSLSAAKMRVYRGLERLREIME